MTRRAWRASVIGSLNVAALILAVRFVLLLAVAGAAALALFALQSPDPMRLGVLAIYMLGAVIPVVWLSARR